MEINAVPSTFNPAKTLNKFVSSVPRGDALHANPHDSNAFVIQPQGKRPLQHYVNEGRHQSEGGIVSTSHHLSTLINAKEDSHTLVSNEYSARNVELYEAHMREQANQSITRATVSVGGVIVGLETEQGDIATPFDFAEDPQLIAAASTLMGESNGDFNAFINKLKSVYGDQVTVETYAEGEGLSVAQTHEILNNSTFEQFVSEQAAHMREILSYKEEVGNSQALQLAFKREVETSSVNSEQARSNSLKTYSGISDLA
ncbi:MAG: hypothetical protein ACPG4U_14405 [Pseudomonadales bacterium]